MAAAGEALALTACIGSIENPAGIGEPDQWTVSVTLENVGDGAGRVTVEPSSGTISDPCPEPIPAGATCRVVIQHRQAIASVLLTADPEDGSDFSGYAGACTGAEPECRIQVPRESQVSVRVIVSFDQVGSVGLAARTP